MQVPIEIKEHMLKKYLEQVQKLQWIHFYKQRNIERGHLPTCDQDELGL